MVCVCLRGHPFLGNATCMFWIFVFLLVMMSCIRMLLSIGPTESLCVPSCTIHRSLFGSCRWIDVRFPPGIASIGGLSTIILVLFGRWIQLLLFCCTVAHVERRNSFPNCLPCALRGERTIPGSLPFVSLTSVGVHQRIHDGLD